MSMIGKTLGTFTLEAQIGKGGMGEVYRAKDQKLGRDVAIKVLPEEFAKDSDRVARFQREAKLLASLNHNNIASIYGLEESDGTHFLVLELIEGDTLADRLTHGAIPVEEALKLALQIAEALEAAHEKGVIHRDLKPANIKVTPDGKVKVLDFGLAKAFAGEQAEVNLSHSPTLSEAATLQGVILGTAAYMSPEQAKGKSVDKQTDVWAFGAVLYEMLTGQAAFQGEDVTEIMASVVKASVNLDALPANIHFRIREVITRCLQKEQRKRYAAITYARYEIEQVLADPSGVFVQPITSVKPKKRLRVGIPWAAAAALLCLIIGGLAVWKLKPTEPLRIMRFDYHLPSDQQLYQFMGSFSFAVSPDHSHFVYGTTEGLYIRSLDQPDARLMQGPDESSQYPFFSPDGQWVGYLSFKENLKLKKIAISGGAPVTLCDILGYGGATWYADNTIVYGARNEGVMRVSADGGTPETLIEAEEGSEYVTPQMLPDGKSVLFTILRGNTSTICVQSLESGERKELLEGNRAQYLATGHIVYILKDNLFAVPFDVDIHKVTGGRVSLVEGTRNYDISDSGTLMYIPATTANLNEHTLVWVDREGKEEPLAAESQNYTGLRISPDGEKVALQISDLYEDNTDIWIWDLARENLTRLTFDEASDLTPLWTPDSKRIVFSSAREGEYDSLYWKQADVTGEDELLTSIEDRNLSAWSWSKNGNTLLLQEADDRGFDIGALSMEDDHEKTPLLHEEYNERYPRISPDGRWMAYVSTESGESQIYVRPFPDIDTDRCHVSTNGGFHPLWSPDSKELFYLNGNSVMAAVVEVAPTFKGGKPETLFQGNFIYAWMELPWDIHPDGKRFLMIKEAAVTDEESPEEVTAGSGPRKINIVLNWFEELKDRVPID